MKVVNILKYIDYLLYTNLSISILFTKSNNIVDYIKFF